ncbi:hypothetical protein [Amycolatopsis sp. cmx-4-68]
MDEAHRLCEALAETYRGRAGLLDAIGAYEDTMRRTGFPAGAAKAST